MAKENKKTFSEKAHEYRAEFGKISWPSREELYKQTITVIITSVLFGAVISVMDIVFETIISQLLGLLI